MRFLLAFVLALALTAPAMAYPTTPTKHVQQTPACTLVQMQHGKTATADVNYIRDSCGHVAYFWVDRTTNVVFSSLTAPAGVVWQSYALQIVTPRCGSLVNAYQSAQLQFASATVALIAAGGAAVVAAGATAGIGGVIVAASLLSAYIAWVDLGGTLHNTATALHDAGC